MEYISVRQAAENWGISERRVLQFCREGRIPGISRFGRPWMIPADAEKPPARKRGPRTQNNGGDR